MVLSEQENETNIVAKDEGYAVAVVEVEREYEYAQGPEAESG